MSAVLLCPFLQTKGTVTQKLSSTVVTMSAQCVCISAWLVKVVQHRLLVCVPIRLRCTLCSVLRDIKFRVLHHVHWGRKSCGKCSARIFNSVDFSAMQ